MLFAQCLSSLMWCWRGVTRGEFKPFAFMCVWFLFVQVYEFIHWLMSVITEEKLVCNKWTKNKVWFMHQGNSKLCLLWYSTVLIMSGNIYTMRKWFIEYCCTICVESESSQSHHTYVNMGPVPKLVWLVSVMHILPEGIIANDFFKKKITCFYVYIFLFYIF